MAKAKKSQPPSAGKALSEHRDQTRPRRASAATKLLLAFAVLLMIAGAALQTWAIVRGGSDDGPVDRSADDSGVSSLAGEPPERGDALRDAPDTSEASAAARRPRFSDLITHGFTDFNTAATRDGAAREERRQRRAERRAEEDRQAAGTEADAIDAGDESDDALSEDAEAPVDLSEVETWSPMIFRLGFSFLIGFAIAYAFRKFLKLAMFLVGVIALLLFGLQYLGVIDVDWSKLAEVYDRALPWLQTQTASIGRFITGYLPSAASAAAGLFMGFRKG